MQKALQICAICFRMLFHNHNNTLDTKKTMIYSTAVFNRFFLNNLTDKKFFTKLTILSKRPMQVQNKLQFSILGNLFLFMYIDLVIEYRQCLITMVANKQFHNIQTALYFWEIT